MTQAADNYWDRTNNGIHPLFMDELPADPMSDPTLAGLMAISEESLKCAEDALKHWKAVGNDHFREAHIKGRLENAVDAYTRGLEVEESEDFKTLRAQLWSNRANCQYKLKKYVNCVEDARHAIAEDPSYVKGYFHAARASLTLLLYKQCIEFCQAAQESCDKEAASILDDIRLKAEEGLAKVQASRAKQLQEKDSIQRELSSRKIEFSQVSDYNHPQCAPPEWHAPNDGELVWSALLLIKEYSVAEVARVTDSLLIGELLEEMFPATGASEPPQWDVRKDYKANSIDVWVLKPDDTRIKISKLMSIKEVVQRVGVIHQHLVFELELEHNTSR